MMTKAEREAWGRCSDNNARLRRENAEAIASRDEALAECNALKIIASSMRWHAVYGAAFEARTSAAPTREELLIAVRNAIIAADESERAWDELATKARGNGNG